MATVTEPSASLRHRLDLRAGILVVIALILVGGSAGSLGGPAFAVVAAAAGLVWGSILTVIAAMLGRSERRRRTWATGVLSVSVVVAGLLAGSGFMGQLLFDTTLADAPDVFASLVRGSVGNAESTPFYLFNTPLEWLLVPTELLLCWRVIRQRRLLLPAAVVFYISRVWTYLYFVPQIFDWSGSTTPLTAGQLEQAQTWVDLSWIRLAIDITIMILLLAALLSTGQRRERDDVA